MMQPSSADGESVPKPPRPTLRWAIALLTVATLALGVISAFKLLGNPFADNRDCTLGKDMCISEFGMSGQDGNLPTEEQFRKELPANVRLAMAWQLSEAQSFQPVTLPANSHYSHLIMFAGCTGGGNLTVTATVEATSRHSRITVNCDGVIPVGAGITAVDSAIVFELSPQGNVTDAVIFVRG